MGLDKFRRRLSADYLTGRKGVTSMGMPVPFLTKGETFHVDSGHANASDSGDGKDFNRPMATMEACVAKMAADNGDTMLVNAGHVESLGAATIDFDKAGITIIGLGHGAQRPRIDFDNAASSIDIGANDIRLFNLTLRPSVTAVLIGIDIEAAVLNTLLEDIEVLPGEDGGGVDEFALGIDIKAGCGGTRINNFRYRQHASAAGTLAGIRLTGASDDVQIDGADIDMLGAGVVAPINGITTLSTKIRVRHCLLVTDAEPGIELLTGTTGVISDNDIFGNLGTVAAAIVADTCARFRNEYIEVAPESNVRIGTASADD